MHAATTPSDVATLVHEIWKSSYADYQTNGRPGLSVNDFVKEADLRHESDSIESLDNWITLFDEFAGWYMSFAAATALDGSKGARPLKWRVYCPLLSYIAAQHLAVRRLVLSGFDAAAKQLVRTLVEHLDLATLLTISPELMEPFSQTDTPEASNHFWHSNIARGKAKRVIGQHAQISDVYLRELERWRREEESILSMTAHPSILASAMTLLTPGATEGDFWFGFFGAKTDSSNRTLQYAMLASLDLLAIGYDRLVDAAEPDGPLVELSEKNELHDHIKYGRDVLMEILVFIVKHSDWDKLKATNSFERWFDDDRLGSESDRS
jgi:hypothetical protein